MKLKQIMAKIENDEFGADDLEDYLKGIVEFGNSNDEVQEECEDIGDKIFLFKAEELDPFWLKIKEGKLYSGKGEIEDPNSTYILSADALIGILTGKLNGTILYTRGELQIKGSLEDGGSLVSLLEILREEMEDAF